jgi:signal transduction histidine kinase
MKSTTIDSKLVELRADPEAILWSDRVRLVAGLLGTANPARQLDPAAVELARLLATDPKWEVRKAFADHLHKLGDADFATFAAILTGDDNAFVKSAAERELGRRRKGHSGTAKRIRGLSRMEEELHQLEARHGTKVADQVRDMAPRYYEGLVGASVHEMRSVVTAMKLEIEHLAAPAAVGNAAVTGKIALRLAKSVAYLERLLGDMKEYTRVPIADRATESVSNLVAEAMQLVRAEFLAAGRDASPITVEIGISPELVAKVSRVPMVLALRNLLKNAHEAFMANETRFDTGTIRVNATSDADGIWLAIADGGMGLNETELAAVLQFIPGRSSKGNLGTGFGLPIARRNIRADGGDLRIESRLDHGTTVTVWLPQTGGLQS